VGRHERHTGGKRKKKKRNQGKKKKMLPFTLEPPQRKAGRKTSADGVGEKGNTQDTFWAQTSIAKGWGKRSETNEKKEVLETSD